MEHLVDAHYVALPSQGNIYCLSSLALSSGAHKLILATLRRRVLSFCYANTQDSFRLKPLVREVHFTCIPSNAEIISIDAFCRSQSGDDYVIGITLIKPSTDGGPPEAYLNTYTDQDWEADTIVGPERTGPAGPAVPGSASEASSSTGSAAGAGTGPGSQCLDNAAQNCFMLELGYVPYQLTHATLPNKHEVVWILGGGDCNVHVFQEDPEQRCYAESSIGDLFPEFAEKLPSPPLWIDTCQREKDLRFSAVGCECGHVRVSQVDETSCSLQASWEVQLQGPVSCLRFFSLANEMHWQNSFTESLGVNLLAVCALQSSQVFMDVYKNGLNNGFDLASSATSDAVLCGTAADVDLDGTAEILLGTYGRQLLVYKWVGGRWELRATRTLPHPIQRLHYMDVTGDGVRELLILTPKGLHVFQHHLEDVERRIEDFFKDISLRTFQKKTASSTD